MAPRASGRPARSACPVVPMPPLMHDDGRPRHHQSVRRVVEDTNSRWHLGAKRRRVLADQQQRPAAECTYGGDAHRIEVVGDPHGRRSQGKDDRWLSRVEEFEQPGLERPRRRRIVERKPGHHRLRRVVRLTGGKHFGEQREDARRRMLPLEQWMAPARQPEFSAKPMQRRHPSICDRRGQVA